MKRRCQAAVCFLIAMIWIAAGNALAWKYGYQIDAEAMKNLEEMNSFPVRVVQKAVRAEAYDTSEFNEPADELSFRVQNTSGSEIGGFKLYFVAYDEEEITQEIDSKELFSFGLEEGAPEIYSVNVTDVSVSNGSYYDLSMAVHGNKFSGVRAIIESYMTLEGETVTNPDYTAWRNLATGNSASGTELD